MIPLLSGYRVNGGMGVNHGVGNMFSQQQQQGAGTSTGTASLLPSIQQGNNGYANSNNPSNAQGGINSQMNIIGSTSGHNPTLPYGGRPMLSMGIGMSYGDAMGLGVGLGAHGPPGSRSFTNPNQNNNPNPTNNQNNANISDTTNNNSQNASGGGGGGARGGNRNHNHSNHNHNHVQNKLHIAPLSKFR